MPPTTLHEKRLVIARPCSHSHCWASQQWHPRGVLVTSSLLLFALGAGRTQAQDPVAAIAEPCALRIETPLGTAKRLVVAAPRSGHGRKAAERICEALRRFSRGAELLSDPGEEILASAGGPVVVVGNLAESRIVRGLYYRFLSATDLWYPGPGGYELRTLCDPVGAGHNVILVGYSDEAGARAAADALVARAADPLPHLAVVKATRLPMPDSLAAALRSEQLPSAAWQVANLILADSKGYLYYLTGEPKLGEEYRKAWRAYIESGYVRTEKIVQPHLFSLSRIVPWRLVESMNLFSPAERLAITRFLYGWAQSDEGWPHVAHCPRVQSPHVPRQNHELMPALALAYTADYFATHYPQLAGPETWRKAAAQAFEPYGPSWKPLCDGLCHGWYMSQPVMMHYGLLDPKHAYFEQGGARKAAECALAVVNNDSWLPTAGDADLSCQFPGAALRIAASYYRDGRYTFVEDRAPLQRRFAWWESWALFPRAFACGIQAEVPKGIVGLTVVPVDELVYRVWKRNRDQAPTAVSTPPSAPIEQCFDKLAIRSGWNLEDDYLLVDGLGGGSHSYDDAGGILDYARLGLSLVVQEDSFVHSSPEHHSAVTIVRDGESGTIPGFAILEARQIDREGNAYVRIRLADYAGADWVREIHLRRGSCAVFCDTVIAKQAGDFAVEARWRTPARLKLDGRVARCRRKSPCSGEVEFHIESSCDPSQLAVEEIPVHLRYQSKADQALWKERYRSDEMVLTALVARQAGHLDPGQSVRLMHLVQVVEPGKAELRLSPQVDDSVSITDGRTPQTFKTAKLGRPAPKASQAEQVEKTPAPAWSFDAGSAITAVRPIRSGHVVVGTQAGKVALLDRDGHLLWSADLAGPVHDIGVTQGEKVPPPPLARKAGEGPGVRVTCVAVGHGPNLLTGFDVAGRRLWSTAIEHDPCPWPWWELPTPAPVQVAGGVDQGAPFFAVGCGDIQLRCFDASGREQWRRRYNEGVPGRVRVADVDGSGRPSIVVGGEILSDTSCCRIFDPQGRPRADLWVEGWTSLLTALAFGESQTRRFIACGASRGDNLHLFELPPGNSGAAATPRAAGPTPASWNRLWRKQLGGQVTGIDLRGPQERLLAATSQGFLLAFDFQGRMLWSRLFPQGLRHLLPAGEEVLVCDNAGRVRFVSLSGEVRGSFPMPGPCSIAAKGDAEFYLVCGSVVRCFRGVRPGA